MPSLKSTTSENGHFSANLDLLRSRDVIGHVTIRLAVGKFLLVIHCNHASNLQR